MDVSIALTTFGKSVYGFADVSITLLTRVVLGSYLFSIMGCFVFL